uniref:Uncharacterized protein n=1 Tax=Rhizophora mucronata TaxID=61149 RepID=A0A2P2QQ08_RHIMU
MIVFKCQSTKIKVLKSSSKNNQSTKIKGSYEK